MSPDQYKTLIDVMTLITTIILSVSTIVLSVKVSKKNTGFNEVQLRQIINSAIYEINECSISLDHDQNNQLLQKVFFSSIECYLNIYDDLCGTYLDGKIDKKRFEKNYKDEIINLVDNEEFKDYYKRGNDQLKSKYKKTLKVYYQLTDKESTSQKLLRDESI